MSCKFDKEILQRYVDNRIDPLEFVFLREHLSYCEECSKDLEALNKVDTALAGIFNEQMFSADMEELLAETLQDCIESVKGKNFFKKSIEINIGMGKLAAKNTTRFAEFLPGAKTFKKGVAFTAKKVENIAVNALKNRFRKLIAD